AAYLVVEQERRQPVASTPLGCGTNQKGLQLVNLHLPQELVCSEEASLDLGEEQRWRLQDRAP
ncbi:unnamed protein product, partial [Urochloa humidicola]